MVSLTTVFLKIIDMRKNFQEKNSQASQNIPLRKTVEVLSKHVKIKCSKTKAGSDPMATDKALEYSATVVRKTLVTLWDTFHIVKAEGFGMRGQIVCFPGN